MGTARRDGLDWYFREEPALTARLAELLDLGIGGLAHVRAPARGAWVAEHDLDGDGKAELLVIPNHSCSNVACELALLRHEAGSLRLVGRTTTFGRPRLSGLRRHGWQSLIRYDLGEGPTCCARRIAVEFATDARGAHAKAKAANG